MVERLVANEKVEGSNPFARSMFLRSHNSFRKKMDELHKKKCIGCDGDTLPFDISEIHKFIKKIDGWDVKSSSEKKYYLEKKFKFINFIESQRFINKVSSISELENHHPDIFFGWGYAKIKIFTHAIKGLSESDFILAAKIDKI